MIGLERIGKLDLLSQVFSQVTIPLAVQVEVGLSIDWLTVRVVQNLAVVVTLKTQIDDGEAEAIAVIGTVGMLLRAKQKGVIAEVKPLLIGLTQADFRIAEALIQNALRLAGEL